MAIEAVTTMKIKAVKANAARIDSLLAMGVEHLSGFSGCLNCSYTRRTSGCPEWILSTYWADSQSLNKSMGSLELNNLIKDICECASGVDFHCFMAGDE